MRLSQRIADVAYRWTIVYTKELISYKKSRENFEQIDLESCENHVEFSSLYYCQVKYIKPEYLEFTFGYRVKNKPNYFKKKLFTTIFSETNFNPEAIRTALDGLVDNIRICEYCDNDNVGIMEYDYKCRQCYIYGTTNEEDSCAICLTNDFGVWLVTSCQHKFHYKCYNKMSEKLCPLCRTQTGSNTSILDY